MRKILLAVLIATIPSDLGAQQQKRVQTCREDGYRGRDCWSRPYDRERFRQQERRWDDRLDERRLREEMEWDTRRRNRERW